MILDKRVSVVAAIGVATIAAAASIVPQAQASPPAAGINATITTEDSTTVRLGGPPFPLSHGQTVSYELEMALNAEQIFPVTDGKGGIEVTLADPENPIEGDRLGKGNSLPITVET